MRPRMPSVLVFALLIASVAPAAAAPADAEAWRRDLLEFYRSHGRVSAVVEAAPARSPTSIRCPAEEALVYEPWVVHFGVETRNRRVFVSVYGNIRRLVGTTQISDVYRGVSNSSGSYLCIDKSGELKVQLGQFVATLSVPCRAGGLDRYEVADFLALVRSHGQGLSLSTEALWSPCGNGEFSFFSTQQLLDRGKEKSQFWGKAFPEARDAARQRPPR